jgi:hypothetical protein
MFRHVRQLPAGISAPRAPRRDRWRLKQLASRGFGLAPALTFVKQADGSLLKTDDNQTEVYRR